MKNVKFVLIFSIACMMLPLAIMFFVAPWEVLLPAAGIMFAIFLVIYFVFLKPFLKNERILKYGEPATAVVLEVAGTGMEINDNPVVKLTLEVTPKRGSKFRTTAKMIVSRFNPTQYHPGLIISVKVDPDDNQSVAVVPQTNNQTMSQQIAATQPAAEISILFKEAMQDVLERMKEMQDELPYSGKKAKGVILGSWLLNVNVNGENPLMEFMLQVTPEDGRPFFAEVKAVVSQERIWVYVPGKEVNLAYDPDDISRMILVPSNNQPAA